MRDHKAVNSLLTDFYATENYTFTQFMWYMAVTGRFNFVRTVFFLRSDQSRGALKSCYDLAITRSGAGYRVGSLADIVKTARSYGVPDA